jgi:flagellar basal-body rod modification protein FlgD
MPVNAVNGASSLTAATSAATRNQAMGQDDFLRMMLAQLENQDPLKPLDPSQFLGQLAQFSTVTGIQSMQSSLERLSGTLGSSTLLEGASLVGRDVLSSMDTARLGAEGGISGAINAPAGANGLRVSVRDLSGALVRSFDVPPGSGLTDFRWDGLDSRGERAAAGTYTFDAVGRYGSSEQSLGVLLQQRVNSVTVDGAAGGLTLNTTGGSVSLGSVRRVL